MADSLIIPTDKGLYCSAGDFYVDPWGRVERAVITHAHSDHARWGSKHYLATPASLGILRERLGADAVIQTLPYRESISINGVQVSFYPAGHVLGSAQVRIEHEGHVTVVSGDYKLTPDPTCLPFEPVKCDTFFSECTFGLPIYRWPDPVKVASDINAWWRGNVAKGRTSVLFAYAFGKAQRVLCGLDPTIGPVFVHGSVAKLLPPYEKEGIKLPPYQYVTEENAKDARGKGFVVAPPSAIGTPWMRKFGEVSTAFASGWMQVRGKRRQKNVDRGFVLSDHCDWDELLRAIDATEAPNIAVMHGHSGPLVQYLRARGKNAWSVATHFEDEEDDSAIVSDKGAI